VISLGFREQKKMGFSNPAIWARFGAISGILTIPNLKLA
jgi:hypothetical protein